MSAALAIARLDLAAIRRSRWILFCLATYAVLAVVLITASSRESTILGFTGSSRVLLSFCHALLLALPLIALTATAPVIQRAAVCVLQAEVPLPSVEEAVRIARDAGVRVVLNVAPAVTDASENAVSCVTANVLSVIVRLALRGAPVRF